MGNANTTVLLVKGNVEMQFTSGKKLLLTNVFHIPEIRKNLVSASILCKKGLKAVVEFDKLILTKKGEFVGKGYYCHGIFKLCTTISVINKTNSSIYFLECSLLSLWHRRIGHVNFHYLSFMNKHGLITHDNKKMKILKYVFKQKCVRKLFQRLKEILRC